MIRNKKQSALPTPTFVQGIVLLLPITMAVMGIVILAPILPLFKAHFSSYPGIEFVAPLALTIPALGVGILSGPAGFLVDKWGRRRSLILGLLFYALIGVLPFFLDSLFLIICARIALGATEALIIVASTTLIGDYFEGREREKWLSAQLAVASISAVFLSALGGMLGDFGWRAPFLLYLLSFVCVLLVLLLTWDPENGEKLVDQTDDLAPFPWKVVLPLAVSAIFGAVIVFCLQVQISVLLTENYAITSPGTIGLFVAAGSVAVPVGTLVYRFISTWRPPLLIATSLFLTGISLIGMGVASDVKSLLALYLLSQFGCGILAPTLVVWAMAPLSFKFRGRGVGLFMSCWWVGQFISPQVVVLVRSLVGDLPLAIQTLGGVTVFTGLLALLVFSRSCIRASDGS